MKQPLMDNKSFMAVVRNVRRSDRSLFYYVRMFRLEKDAGGQRR